MWGIRTRRPLKKKQTKQILVKQNIKCTAENFVQEFLKETVKGKTAFNKDDGSSGKLEALRGNGTQIQLCS